MKIISTIITILILTIPIIKLVLKTTRENQITKPEKESNYRYMDYWQEVNNKASQEWASAYKQANAEHAITVKESKQFELECKERIRRERELEKLENEIPKLKFNIGKYNSDIWHFTVLLEDLNMQFDEANIEAYDCHHRGDYANEKKKRTTINQLRRQIRSANNSLEKTKFDKEQAEKKLEEAIFLIGDVA